MNEKTAFLYGLIDQLIYIQISKSLKLFANKNMVYELLKVLYGLKQASKSWYKRLSNFLLKKLGFQQINADYSIFISATEINNLIVSTSIDDIKIMEVKNSKIISRVKEKLMAAFEMLDMRSISSYLGLKVSRDCNKMRIKLFQSAVINKILAKFYLSQVNTLNTLMKESLLERNKKEATIAKIKRYQEIISSRIFSMVGTRPDIAFATYIVSRFAKSFSHQYSEAVKTIFQYLKATRKTRITYREEQEDDLIIKEYSNSNWAGDHSTKKLMSEYIFMLNRRPIS